MLTLYAIVRLALSRSPTREQREVKFAQPSATSLPPGGERPSEGGAERRVRDGQAHDDSPSPIEQATHETHTDVQGILSSLDTQQMFEEMKGDQNQAELFDRMFEKEETLAGIDIVGAARDSGIEISIDPEMPPSELLRQILEYDNTMGIPPDQKRNFILSLLQESPRVTMALSHGLLNRLQTYEEQERILAISREKLGAEGMAEAVKVAQRLTSLDEGVRHWPRSVFKNAVKALRVTQGFGARFWGSDERTTPEKDDRRRQGYLESMREEVTKLTALFCAQVKDESGHIGMRLEERVAAIMRKKADGTLTPTDDLILANAGSIIERLKHRVVSRFPSFAALPSVIDTDFAERCTELLRTFDEVTTALDGIRRDANALSERWGRDGTEKEEQEAKEARAWAERCRGMVALLTAGDGDPSLSSDTRKRLRALMDMLQDEHMPTAFSQEQREFYAYWLQSLCHHGEQGLRAMAKRSHTQEANIAIQIDTAGIDTWIAQQEHAVQEEEQQLIAVLRHPICVSLAVADQVHSLADDLKAKLHVLKNEKMRAQERRELSARIGTIVQAMCEARERIGALEQSGEDEAALTTSGILEVLPPAEYERRFPLRTEGAHSLACYEKGKLYLRSDVPPVKRRETIRHERGHLIIAILTEQSALLPELLSERVEQMEPETFGALEACGKRWGITRAGVEQAYADQLNRLSPSLRGRRLEALYRRELLEEGHVRKSLADEDAGTLQASDRDAFAALGGTPEQSGMVRHLTDDDFDLGEPDTKEEKPAEDGGSIKTEEYNPTEDFEQIQVQLQEIRSFGGAYPQYASTVTNMLDSPDGCEAWFRFFQSIYRSEQETTPTGKFVHMPDPQHDPQFQKGVKSFKAHVTERHKKITEISNEISDPNEAHPKKKGTLLERLGIQTLCILDIMRIYKEFKEDIEGMWHSMQDGKTADAKAALAKNLPVYIPGTKIKIPIIGKYTERLPHYTERARNSKELDRVKKWEDAFKNLDADSLLELIGANPTRDQLRASIQLLVEKGHMNWGDERVWKALNKYSKYEIPIGACQRNELLRDKWLHKAISNIWGDKEMYDEWMTSNESNYDKHKNAYTHAADNLSNISGQMAHELESILTLFAKHTENGQLKKGHSLPEEVNPHHFEEILHYAMRNGKMSMEAKIFYLVQGIRYRLLPINRLRVLAGQKGELLSKFPFLDYFYQRHNTLPEIDEIGRLLDEPGAEDKFKPGPKTTLFMRLVIAKDDGVAKRISKATSRKMEEVDHEDVPYILTDVNWAKMRNLMDVVSGGRWKVTNQGMQNTYVGFNEKFKVYAAIAEMEADGMETFPESFVRNLAESAAAYVCFDNQVVRASSPGGNVEKGNLDWTEIDHQVPVSSNGPRTCEFRNRMRDFVLMLAQRVGMTDADLADTGVTLAEMLASQDRDEGRIDVKSADKKKKIHEGTERFAIVFQQKIMARPDILKSLLREWQKSPRTAFLDSTSKSSTETKFTRESIRNNYRKVLKM